MDLGQESACQCPQTKRWNADTNGVPSVSVEKTERRTRDVVNAGIALDVMFRTPMRDRFARAVVFAMLN